jgi:perosamine synthetase
VDEDVRARIPVASADLSPLEESYVLEAVRSSWISSTGPFVTRFEATFAELCGVRAAISVSNGTVAIHLALLALNAGPGDEVLVPSMTYVATANAIRYVGADPVFVDVDPATWCIDPALLEQGLSPRTKGIIAVDLYGHPADMDAINEFADAHGLWVIEDAAEAHLARYKGRRTGGLGTIGTFSFYGNKIFTSGEGGAVTTNDVALEARMRLFRGQGMDPERRYFFPVIGYNYRLTNVACAILCAQLERSDEIADHRTRIHESYTHALQDIAGLTLQPVAAWAQPACWMFSVIIDPEAFGRTRDELAEFLAADGIETRPFFLPVHTLPPYRESVGAKRMPLPVSIELGESGINLPTFNRLTANQIARIAERIRAARR